MKPVSEIKSLGGSGIFADELDLVEAFISRSAIEAGMIQGMLEEEGIDATLSNDTGARMMPFMPPCLDIRILVQRRDLQAARELIEEFQQLEADPEGQPPEPEALPASLLPRPQPESRATVGFLVFLTMALYTAFFSQFVFAWGVSLSDAWMVGTAIMAALVTFISLRLTSRHLRDNEGIRGESRKWWAYGMVSIPPIFLPLYFILHMLRTEPPITTDEKERP